MTSLLTRLYQRGVVADITDEGLGELLESGQLTLYAGFDPSASSLHVGSLLPVMTMARFQRAGHRVIALVGGATGMVGDPSGKSSERNLLTSEQVQKNANDLKSQLARFLEFDGPNAAVMVDNNDWISKMSFIDWLRDVGKHFSIGYMLGKDSVRRRLESESGISYTEFSYMTMQAYDFLHLCNNYDCMLQIGGTDQWGNITAGIDLIRRVYGRPAYGLTMPLVTTASGEKFGKSAGNAIWLDERITSPFRFFQYWMQVDDRDIERFLKFFTFYSSEEIASVVTEHEAEPERRLGQRRLATALTESVHGTKGLDRAEKATNVLFGGAIDGLSDTDLLDIFADVPSAEISAAQANEENGKLIDVLVATQCFASKGEARRMIQGGGLYINNERVSDPEEPLRSRYFVSGTVMVVRKGRRDYRLVRRVG